MYLLAKFGFDTAANEPSKVCPIERCSSPGEVLAPQLSCNEGMLTVYKTKEIETAQMPTPGDITKFIVRLFISCSLCLLSLSLYR